MSIAERTLADVERDELIAFEIAHDDVVLCEIRAGELRLALRICDTERAELAAELAAVNCKRARLTTFLRTGVRPVEPTW